MGLDLGLWLGETANLAMASMTSLAGVCTLPC